MDQERRKGTSKQVAGSLKEAMGKITGDTKIQAEGTAEKKAGETQKSPAASKAFVGARQEE